MKTHCTGARNDFCCLVSGDTEGTGSLLFPGRVTQSGAEKAFLISASGCALRCAVVVYVYPCSRTSCSGITGIGSPAGSRCPFVGVAWLLLSPWTPSPCSLGSESSVGALGEDPISHRDFFHLSFLSVPHPITCPNTKQRVPVIHENPP